MRVLQVIDGMHPRDGGPPVVVAGSAAALQAHGAIVSVLTTLLPGDEQEVRATWRPMLESQVDLQFCAPAGLANLTGLRAWDPAIRTAIEAADVIHLHGFWSPMLVIAAQVARRAGKPYFISTHGLLDWRAMTSSWPKWVKKRLAIKLLGFEDIFRHSAGIIYGSETEDEESWDPVPGMRKLFISNGVDAKVGKRTPSPESLKKLAEVAPEFAAWDRSILFYSRIHPEKGLDMLVKAFNALTEDFPGWGLLIAGILRDEQYGAYVQQLVHECPAPDRIALTTRLTGPDSHFVYSLCDVFVLPSHAEGFSVALVEALAHEMPALITRYCHAPLVGTEGAGLVVEPTPEAIEAGLRQILSMTDEQLAATGRNARTLFERRYTWDSVVRQLEAAYQASILSRNTVAGHV